MTDLQTKQLAVLDATCAEYNSTNRADIGGDKCFYLHAETNRRCAIGRLLSDDQAKYLETNFKVVSKLFKNFSTSTNDVEKSIYNTLSEYGKSFLIDLQDLHDDRKNWDEDGLSKIGRLFANEIEYRLDELFNN